MRMLAIVLACVFSLVSLTAQAAPQAPPKKEVKKQPKKPGGNKGLEVEPVNFKKPKDKPRDKRKR